MRLRSLIPFAERRNDKQIPSEEDDMHIYRSVAAKPVVMVTVLGVKSDLLEEIIQITSRKFEPKHRLVFLTDSSEFGLFRSNGAIFEYFPPLLEQRLHAAVMPWPAYLAERWALLVAKWRPIHVIAYGQNIDGFLAAALPSADRAPVRRP
ncbi:hypothetical protein [Mesorhizobium sp. LNHC209A00]|uniref:hypothetical protein n=1 Tax=Mesorhizobium TaxID=68287 RepID=UPI0003CFDA42|nr:hypothetical protein [Mesorhizobium sp. LNHC209A00]ESY90710.1 hypothetical protein X738_30010 [Mesorhizobium sp. LNHC209A00]